MRVWKCLSAFLPLNRMQVMNKVNFWFVSPLYPICFLLQKLFGYCLSPHLTPHLPNLLLSVCYMTFPLNFPFPMPQLWSGSPALMSRDCPGRAVCCGQAFCSGGWAATPRSPGPLSCLALKAHRHCLPPGCTSHPPPGPLHALQSCSSLLWAFSVPQGPLSPPVTS